MAREKMNEKMLHAHHHGRMANFHKKLSDLHEAIAAHHDEMETRFAGGAHEDQGEQEAEGE